MPHNKDLPPLLRHGEEEPCLFRFCQDGQPLLCTYLIHRRLRMPGVGRQEHIVEPSYERYLAVHHLVPEHAEHFAVKLYFINTVMIVEPRLRPPAQMERRRYVLPAPLHDLCELFPVIHLFKRDLLHRGARDDEAVEFLILDLAESLIEFIQMARRRILRLMAGHGDK